MPLYYMSNEVYVNQEGRLEERRGATGADSIIIEDSADTPNQRAVRVEDLVTAESDLIRSRTQYWGQHWEQLVRELQTETPEEHVFAREYMCEYEQTNTQPKGDNNMEGLNNSISMFIDNAKADWYAESVCTGLKEYDKILTDMKIKAKDIPAYIFYNDDYDLDRTFSNTTEMVKRTTDYLIWIKDNKTKIHPIVAKYINDKAKFTESRLNTIKANIRNYKRKVDEYSTYLEDYQMALFKETINLKTYKDPEFNMMEQVQGIVDSGAYSVKRFDQNMLVLETAPVTLKHKNERAGIDINLQMGTYYVELPYDLSDNTVRVKRGIKNYMYNGFWHPHINGRGHMCWGSAKEAISNALSNARIDDYLILLNQLLTHYSKDSPYYALEELWDYVQAGYEPVSWNQSPNALPRLPHQALVSRVNWYWCLGCEAYGFYDDEDNCRNCGNQYDRLDEDDEETFIGRDNDDSIDRQDFANNSEGYDIAPDE